MKNLDKKVSVYSSKKGTVGHTETIIYDLNAWGDLSSTFSDSGLKEPRRVIEPRIPAHKRAGSVKKREI
ncbi:hypothetical protein [Moorena sp. SIO1G6]|uniref:hypothetical protein n=1 Tax=Moorena sp. SIO1G6 TaxID=2607840 RepID=UPI0025804A33|nr:hypothetical protein [Moorena sp. SIO1G6]